MRIIFKSIVLVKLSLLFAVVFVSQQAFSQQVSREDFSCEGMPYMDVGERRIIALEQQLNRQLANPRNLLNPVPPEDDPDAEVPDPNPVAAIAALDRIRTDRLESHEKAEIYNLYAYSHYLTENIIESLRYYKLSIEEEGANGPLVVRNLKTIAQLSMLEDKFDDALDFYINWACIRLLNPEVSLSANDYGDLARIHYRRDEFNQALSYIEKSIDLEEVGGEPARESSYSMQRSIYYQQNDIPAVLEILKKMVVYYPNVRYWREMGGMFSELEDTESQLATFLVAYLQGGLDTAGQVKGLGYLMIGAGAPYEGAVIMEKGIDEGLIEEDEEVMRAIGSAYYQARELEKALPWMERAAEEKGEGEAYGGLAGIYTSLLQYEDAIRTGNQALRLDVNRPDQVKMTIGAAEVALRRYDDAIATFRSITDSRSRDAAQSWIRYSNAEKEREAQIRASGIDLENLPDIL